MNVASVVSLGGLPSEAKYGLAAVFYYVFAAVFFLVPLGLVAAELATGWPERGGVFRWVSEAFGARWGFLAIFILWIQTTIWFPSCLIYGGSALAFAGPALNWDEALAANKYYIAAIVLLLYWSATACALRGVGLVSIIARWSGLIGTIAPAALLIVFGVVYYHSGRPMYVDIDWKDLVPDFSNFDNLVLAAGVFLCYAGLEMNAIHVEDIRNARRAYPLAILISALVIVAIYTLGTLTIALIIQPGQIDLTQSLLVTYRDFFSALRHAMAFADHCAGADDWRLWRRHHLDRRPIYRAGRSRSRRLFAAILSPAQSSWRPASYYSRARMRGDAVVNAVYSAAVCRSDVPDSQSALHDPVSLHVYDDVRRRRSTALQPARRQTRL